MNGLINSAMGAETAPQMGGPGEAPPQERPPQQMPQQEGQADPVEQLQRSALMAFASDVIYGEEGEKLEDVLATMEGNPNGDPIAAAVSGAARTTANIVSLAVRKHEKGGKKMSDRAVLSAGVEIVERLLSIAADAGLMSLEEARQVVPQAVEQAASIYVDMQNDPGEVPADALANEAPAQQGAPQPDQGAGMPPMQGGLAGEMMA